MKIFQKTLFYPVPGRFWRSKTFLQVETKLAHFLEIRNDTGTNSEGLPIHCKNDLFLIDAFENAERYVSPFGFFWAVGKNREWGYRKGREREELGKVPRSTKKKKKNSQMENRGLKWKERRQDWKEKTTGTSGGWWYGV